MDFLPAKKAYRPPTYQCSWWTALSNLPRRIGTPPAAEGKYKHRSCNIVPIFRVTLEDVLDGRHLPPLSLKDFEEYLLFEERSAENLYFVLWLREYTKRHRAWFATATTHSRSLALSFARAKSTFFSHSSAHELNLASILISNFLIAAEGQPHPMPTIFNQISREVEHMLRESLLRFVASRTKNAGKQRVWCALVGGIGVSLIALAPLLVSILGNKPRVLRLAALPILWLGATIFLSSIHGICFIIYILGDARQLYPFELARPTISSPRPVNPPAVMHVPEQISGFTFGHAYTQSTDTAPNSANIHVSSPFPESPTTLPKSVVASRLQHSRNVSTSSGMSVPTIPPYSPCAAFDTAPFIAPFDTRSLDEKNPWPAPTPFNFDDLPGRRRVIPHQRSSSLNLPTEPFCSRVARGMRSHGNLSTPFFAPLTRVWSPVITRAQWEIVVRSAAVALVFSAIVVGAVLAVPVHGWAPMN